MLFFYIPSTKTMCGDQITQKNQSTARNDNNRHQENLTQLNNVKNVHLMDKIFYNPVYPILILGSFGYEAAQIAILDKTPNITTGIITIIWAASLLKYATDD